MGHFILLTAIQFLKFQAFADTLTKETQDLKVKIEGHKRENRRLATLLDQQKDDAARLSVRLSGTEKQRDDALEALVLQQEIAEELERERKRNRKELSALQHTNMTIARQRDEARRVVLHLRSLISGQHHHMEHLVKTLTSPDELAAEIEAGFAAQEEAAEAAAAEREYFPLHSRVVCDADLCPEEGVDENDARFMKNLALASRRISTQTFIDVADRHLKDKTDAIAHIIRNIAEQCQAAVEGLQLAHDAELGRPLSAASRARDFSKSRRGSSLSTTASDDGAGSSSAAASDVGDDGTLLRPNSGRISSIPPTPDLIPNRSSTSMSIASTTATTPERGSQQYLLGGGIAASGYPGVGVHGHDIPTKIVEDDEDVDDLAAHDDERILAESESNPIPGPPQEPGVVGKHAESLMHRPSGARISALGGSR